MVSDYVHIYLQLTYMIIFHRHLTDPSGQPTQLKLIDFQTAQFDSVVHDLIAFLFTSVSTRILEDNYHSLLTFYFNAFIDTLLKVGVNSNAYSYEA